MCEALGRRFKLFDWLPKQHAQVQLGSLHKVGPFEYPDGDGGPEQRQEVPVLNRQRQVRHPEGQAAQGGCVSDPSDQRRCVAAIGLSPPA